MSYTPLSFGSGGNVTFGSTGSQITATAPAGGGGGVALSAGTVAITSGTAVFSNANGVTFGANGQTVTASHNGLTSQSGQAVSAANGSSAFQTLSLVNSNGVSFSTAAGGLVASHAINVSVATANVAASALAFGNVGSDNLNWGLTGSTITASFNQTKPTVGVSGDASSAYVGDIIQFRSSNDVFWPIGTNGLVVAQPVQRWSATGNTTNASTMQQTGLAHTISGAGGVSVGFAGGAIIISGGAGGGGGVAIGAGTQTQSTGTIIFSNSNGITFGLGGGTITASHNGLTSQSNQAFSAANGSATFQTLSFANSNGVSFSTGTQGLFASHNGLTNINVSAGTTSQNLSALTFSNLNGVTFGLNGSVVTASVNAGGGGGPTLSMHPATPWPWATSTMYSGASTTTAGGFRSTLSMYVAPFVLPAAVTFNAVDGVINAGATAAGTGSGSNRHVFGVYTRTGSTLSLLTEFAFNAVHSQSSVTAQTLSWWAGAFAGSTAASTSRISGNVSASISGSRLVGFNASSSATSLSAGQYFLAHIHNARTTGSALFNMSNAWRYSVSQFTAQGFGFSNTTGPAYCECNGIASSTVTAANIMEFGAPASIHISAITATGGTSRNQWPIVILRSVTA